MFNLALGLIETIGLAGGIEAADAAVKSANVTLLGYELTRGDGMVTVKIEGDVGAVKAAVSAAVTAASKICRVVSSHVIPRPSVGLDSLIANKDTVGFKKPEPPKEPDPPKGPEPEPDPPKGPEPKPKSPKEPAPEPESPKEPAPEPESLKEPAPESPKELTETTDKVSPETPIEISTEIPAGIPEQPIEEPQITLGEEPPKKKRRKRQKEENSTNDEG
jgi:hypothetical protein